MSKCECGNGSLRVSFAKGRNQLPVYWCPKCFKTVERKERQMKDIASLTIEINSGSVPEATKRMNEFAEACKLATEAFKEFLEVNEQTKQG